MHVCMYAVCMYVHGGGGMQWMDGLSGSGWMEHSNKVK